MFWNKKVYADDFVWKKMRRILEYPFSSYIYNYDTVIYYNFKYEAEIYVFVVEVQKINISGQIHQDLGIYWMCQIFY